MAPLHPLALTLNQTLSQKNPHLFAALSKKGQRAYFPKLGILSQSADANGKPINATIGIALDETKAPMRLQAIADAIDLPATEIFPYATSYGKPGLRALWQEQIRQKNPTLHGDISVPVVTAGLTHALSVVGYLFLDANDHLLLPAPYWDNYELIFEEAYEAVLDTFEVFRDGRFNLESLEEKLRTTSGKQVVFLNFPQNPTGYTPLVSEMKEIVRLLKDSADRGNTVIVMIDDAYFGLVFEDDVYRESIFAELAQLHENILAVKIDGPTKEEYAWGLRIGFITYASKGLDAASLKALEDKTAGVVRGTVSNCSQPAQSLLERAMKDPSYPQNKATNIALLHERFRVATTHASNPEYADVFRLLPCNSGYFLCLQLAEGLEAEAVRQKLLADYGTGIIALGNLIRVAFSSVPTATLPTLFATIAAACRSFLIPPMTPTERIAELLATHTDVAINLSRANLIEEAIERREVLLTKSGAIAMWNPKNATGRIPKDTYTVKHDDETLPIEWKAANNIAMSPEMFDSLLSDAVAALKAKDRLFVQDRSVSADPQYALNVRTIGPRSATALFAENMFRPAVADNSQSIFGNEPFTIVVVPTDTVDTTKYEGKLRIENGKPVNILIAMDFQRKIGLVYGTLYCGAVKKLVFTVMNALLPARGVLSLHCSASEDQQGDTHLFLGLSGTGKTTLSADPKYRLIGDDEHLWSSSGTANLEFGSYAKLIKLRQDKEPIIYHAVFGQRPLLEHGCIIENTMVYPDGSVDVDDDRLTENSRASFPLSYIENVVPTARGTHPRTIVFLTADARGVLPPVAKLSADQALLWFLMGYTSKLAGTETGITSPVTTFSRFFGGPFMPLTSETYLNLLRDKLSAHQTTVYLINTGWTGGAYGTGKRMDITVTRAIVDAALSGPLRDIPTRTDERFHLDIPTSCPGVDPTILDPQTTWSDVSAYATAADQLAREFSAHFDKHFAGTVSAEVEAACPGKKDVAPVTSDVQPSTAQNLAAAVA